MSLFALAAAAIAGKGDLELGGGPRRVANAFDAGSLGLHAFGRYGLAGAWTVEAGVYLDPITAEPSALTRSLVSLAYQVDGDRSFRQPFGSEQLAARALIDWSFGPRVHADEITGGLHLLGGVEVRSIVDHLAAPDPDSGNVVLEDDPSSHLAAGPAIGVALDVWIGERVGVRWSALDRLAVEEAPGDPPAQARITASIAWSLDFMVAL